MVVLYCYEIFKEKVTYGVKHGEIFELHVRCLINITDMEPLEHENSRIWANLCQAYRVL